MEISIYISIIILNVNGLNAPIKGHSVADCIKKQDPSIYSLHETHFRSKDTSRLKVRGWKKVFHANEKEKKAGVGIIISDTADIFFCITFLLEYNCFTKEC